MSVNPVGAGGPTGQVTPGKWPTDDEILALAQKREDPHFTPKHTPSRSNIAGYN
jgi:hypothetical protein